MVLRRLGRRCGKGNFHIEIKPCRESLILSRSSEQVRTIENNGYVLSPLRGHSWAIVRAPWIPQSLRHAAEELSFLKQPFCPITLQFKNLSGSHCQMLQVCVLRPSDSPLNVQLFPHLLPDTLPVMAVSALRNAPLSQSCPFIIALGMLFPLPAHLSASSILQAFKMDSGPITVI